MIKVINLVSLLAAPIIIQYRKMTPVLIVVVVVLFLIVAASIWYSKRSGLKEFHQVEEAVAPKTGAAEPKKAARGKSAKS
jgi:K(+)-stimulated pyrophosphate-energized sodium pump